MNECLSDIKYIRDLASALGIQRKKVKSRGGQAIRESRLEPDLEDKRDGGVVFLAEAVHRPD